MLWGSTIWNHACNSCLRRCCWSASVFPKNTRWFRKEFVGFRSHGLRHVVVSQTVHMSIMYDLCGTVPDIQNDVDCHAQQKKNAVWTNDPEQKRVGRRRPGQIVAVQHYTVQKCKKNRDPWSRACVGRSLRNASSGLVYKRCSGAQKMATV